MLTVRVKQLLPEEEGVSSIEYALLASLIAVVCVAAVTAVGTSAANLYLIVCNGVAWAIGSPPC